MTSARSPARWARGPADEPSAFAFQTIHQRASPPSVLPLSPAVHGNKVGGIQWFHRDNIPPCLISHNVSACCWNKFWLRGGCPSSALPWRSSFERWGKREEEVGRTGRCWGHAFISEKYFFQLEPCSFHKFNIKLKRVFVTNNKILFFLQIKSYIYYRAPPLRSSGSVDTASLGYGMAVSLH